MSSLDIAPYPEGAPAFGRDRCRIRRRLRVSFRRAGSCTFWRLGFRQFSFHRIARVPWRTVPDTWTRPPVSCHALFPLTFRRQVRHRTQGHPSNPSRLRRGYNEAPRGAPRICRKEGVACARTYAQLCITFHDSAGALTSQRQLLRKVFIWPHRGVHSEVGGELRFQPPVQVAGRGSHGSAARARVVASSGVSPWLAAESR
jgi:hypothetical protein